MIRKILIELRTAAKRTKRVPLIFAVIAPAVLILIVFVGFIIYLPYDQLVNGPKAAETLKDSLGTLYSSPSM
jgi:preprotein translocase subunit Sss1